MCSACRVDLGCAWSFIRRTRATSESPAKFAWRFAKDTRLTSSQCASLGSFSHELRDGVRVFRLPFSHRRGAGVPLVVWEYFGFTAMATLKVAARMMHRRYDVVQVHNPPDFLILASVLPRLLGAKVVLDIHDLSPDMFAMRFKGRKGAVLADQVLRLIERLATRFANVIITVHEPVCP